MNWLDVVLYVVLYLLYSAWIWVMIMRNDNNRYLWVSQDNHRQPPWILVFPAMPSILFALAALDCIEQYGPSIMRRIGGLQRR